jgi:hypothetical protein
MARVLSAIIEEEGSSEKQAEQRYHGPPADTVPQMALGHQRGDRRGKSAYRRISEAFKGIPVRRIGMISLSSFMPSRAERC